MNRLLLAVLCMVLLLPSLAMADSPYPIVFPVAGENTYSDSFGDPRGDHTHQGVDIMADKMTPVVAVASGTVGWMHDEQGGECCAMQLIHDDGFSSWYIHLNNDTPDTDDGQGWGFAPGITTGVHVEAGELIGYVGDSGNAEGAPSHLHFELRDLGGVAFDPYPSLLAAMAVNPYVADEMFFYREDGLFRFYDVDVTGDLGSPLLEGDGYTNGWSTITGVDLDGDGQDEMFFYRDDGLFRFYHVNPDGTLPLPMLAGDAYTVDWTSITAVDLDGDGQDEMFFYRDDGLFRYYDVNQDGTIGTPLITGDAYTVDWTSITAVDLDGDGQDEMFFYRDDGLFRFYQVNPDGTLPSPMLAGDGYTTGWSAITALDLEGDGQDEMFFYRNDGLFRYYNVNPDGTLDSPILEGSNYTAGWDSIVGLNLDSGG